MTMIVIITDDTLTLLGDTTPITTGIITVGTIRTTLDDTILITINATVTMIRVVGGTASTTTSINRGTWESRWSLTVGWEWKN